MEPSVILLWLIRSLLAASMIEAVIVGRWMPAAIALAVLALTALPWRVARRAGLELPPSFLAAIGLFLFATLFLGEVFDFYYRFWWWDLVLHFGAAMAIGLFAFLLIFMLFEGDRYAAPPWALATLSFCVAITVGALWEIFEFLMDQGFGLNMQKSGLVDTMVDLLLDAAGATIGALSGYLYLKGRQFGTLGAAIEEFVRLNRKRYAKRRRKNRQGTDPDR